MPKPKSGKRKKFVSSEGKPLSEELIESLPGNRWQKHGMDRIYIDDKTIGFIYETYKSSGLVKNAEVLELPIIKGMNVDMSLVNSEVGEPSHNKVNKWFSKWLSAGKKNYIDVKTGKIYAPSGWREERVRYIFQKTELELMNKNKK